MPPHCSRINSASFRVSKNSPLSSSSLSRALKFSTQVYEVVTSHMIRRSTSAVLSSAVPIAIPTAPSGYLNHVGNQLLLIVTSKGNIPVGEPVLSENASGTRFRYLARIWSMRIRRRMGVRSSLWQALTRSVYRELDLRRHVEDVHFSSVAAPALSVDPSLCRHITRASDNRANP